MSLKAIHRISIALVFAQFGSIFAQELTPVFELGFSVGAGAVEGNGVAVDAAGNIYVTGQFQGPEARIANTPLAGGGAQDYFLASFTSAGAVRWAVGAATAGPEFGSSLKTAPNGDVIVCGAVTGPIDFHGQQIMGNGSAESFVARYNSDGQLVWVQTCGGSGYDQADDVALDSAGNIIVVGKVNGTVTVGSNTIGTLGRQRHFIVKLDPLGNFLWAKSRTADAAAATTGVALDAADNIYYSGQQTFQGTGSAFVGKFNATGDQVWLQTHAGTQSASGIGVDADGNVYVCGSYTANPVTFGTITLASPNFASRGFLVKYDSNGAPLWADWIGGRAYRLVTQPDGTTHTAGHFASNSQNFNNRTVSVFGNTTGQEDGFLTKHTSGGTMAWVVSAGSFNRDVLRSVAQDAAGRLHVTGEGTNVSFRTGAESFAGPVAVARLAPPRPRLSVVVSGERLILSWPEAFAGYTVETTGFIGEAFASGGVELTPVEGQPNTFSMAAPPANLFFRLMKP